MNGQFEILEHTADIGVRAFGRTLEELFGNAALGVESIALDVTGVQPKEEYRLSASGEDIEALLVNWLNEIIFYLDARHVAVSRFHFDNCSETEVAAIGWGEVRDPKRHPPRLVVKAATYHQLKIARQNGNYVAEVYLDI